MSIACKLLTTTGIALRDSDKYKIKASKGLDSIINISSVHFYIFCTSFPVLISTKKKQLELYVLTGKYNIYIKYTDYSVKA